MRSRLGSPALARILIVGGGARGRELAASLLVEGHALRITTRAETGRAAIEALGAECWVGTPDRLATLRGALDRVAVICWLLATASGPPEELRALHSTRLQLFLTQAIDTTVRGLVFEAVGAPELEADLRPAVELVASWAACNMIPVEILRADPGEPEPWLEQAGSAVASLLARA
jgi:hypothetical protein